MNNGSNQMARMIAIILVAVPFGAVQHVLADVEREASISPILALAPADALTIAFGRDMHELFANPTLVELRDEMGKSGALIEALSELIAGDALIAFAGTPAQPTSWSYTMATQTRLSFPELVKLFEGRIIPGWNSIGHEGGRLQGWQAGNVFHMNLVGPATTSMTMAIRDGMMFVSSRISEVEQFLASDSLPNRFVDSENFAGITENDRAILDGMVYVNLVPLLSLAESLSPQDFKIHEALQLERFKYLAFLSRTMELRPDKRNATPGTPPSTAPGPDSYDEVRTKNVQRLVVGMTGIGEGIWRAAAPEAGEAFLAQYFPAGTPAFVSGKLVNGSVLVEQLLKPVEVLAPEIRTEFYEECRDFLRETRVDPMAVLKNLVDEWAVGGPIGDQQDVLMAVRIENPAVFRTHLELLRQSFDLRMTQKTYRGSLILRADREDGPFFFANIDDVLVLAKHGKTLKGAIDAYAEGAGLAFVEEYRSVTAQQTGVRGFVDLRELLALLPDDGMDSRMSELLRDYARRVETVGMALVGNDNQIVLDMMSSGEADLAPIGVVTSILIPSLARSRQQARRMVLMNNVKNIMVGLHVYASDHGNQLPDSLDSLKGEYVPPPVLGNPDRDDAGKGEVYYLYRKPESWPVTANAHEFVIISEPALRQGGAVFGFADGHSEHIEGARATRLLEEMKESE
ncbi:MAG: DUF3352 domain-containing protein [Planctomycetota bacterium]|jgi:hypothetical protein